METIYCQADAIVLPSLYEGMSMTLIEAMMREIPVLASRRGGNPDLIQDEVNGYLCGTDSSSIAAALKRIYTDQERRAIASNGRKSVQRYSARHMTESYERLYMHLRTKERF